MKDKSSVGAFLHFMLSEEALHRGWDFGTGVVGFLKGELEPDFVVYRLKNDNRDVLNFSDCAEIIEHGTYSVSAMKFFTELDKLLPSDLEDHEVIFVSMHSGGSDYFTVSMLRSILAP